MKNPVQIALQSWVSGRNSPTTLNVGFHHAQFWEGRATTLEEQAKGPVLSPVEMAMPDEAEILKRLRDRKEDPGIFQAAFGAEHSQAKTERQSRTQGVLGSNPLQSSGQKCRGATRRGAA